MKLLSSWTRRPSSAAEWFARLHFGKISTRVDARFKRWLGSDVSHEPEYERQELVWELALELEQDPEIAALVNEVEHSQPTKIETPQHGLISSLPPWMQGWNAIGALASVLIVAVGSVWLWSVRMDSGQLYATGIGESRTVILADGSQVALNTATRLRVVFTKNIRTVVLEQGEATFEVAHDPSHPFEVNAAGGKARALGTQFNVFKNEAGVMVTVLEGTVEVIPGNVNQDDQDSPANSLQHAVLYAGQEVDYSQGKLARVQVGNVERIKAWHTRRIAFHDVTLESAIAEFNRYSQIPLVLGDHSLAARHVTGVFRVGETEALLTALQEAFGVRAVRGSKSIVLWPATLMRPISGVITTQNIQLQTH